MNIRKRIVLHRLNSFRLSEVRAYKGNADDCSFLETIWEKFNFWQYQKSQRYARLKCNQKGTFRKRDI